MRTFILSMACLLFLMGCRQASNYSDTDFNAPVIRIDIDNMGYQSVLLFSDIFEQISFVKLETTDSSMIGRIDKIVATEDKYIILDISIAKTVFVFDHSGKFLNRIGTNGNGPAEYDSPHDIVYDKYNDELLVQCHNKKSILRFTLDGTFVGKTTFDWWVNSIFVTCEDTYLLYFNNKTQPNRKKNDYNIAVINKEGKVVENFLPFEEKTGELSPPRPVFSHYNDEVIFAPHYSTIIYSLENHTIKSKYYLDFGKKTIPETTLNHKSNQEVKQVVIDNDYAFNLASFETATHVICQFSYKGLIYDCFYAKESKKTKISMTYINDMYGLNSGRSYFYLAGNSLITAVEPHSFIIDQEAIGKIQAGQEVNEILINSIRMAPSSKIITNNLKNNLIKAYQSRKITLSAEELDFINSIRVEDNPLLMIVTPKVF